MELNKNKIFLAYKSNCNSNENNTYNVIKYYSHENADLKAL